MTRHLVRFCALLALSCGSVDSTPTSDATTIDSAAADDAPAPGPDAPPGTADARPQADAPPGAADASPPVVDASTACNGVGTPCGSTGVCPVGLICQGLGVCAPDRAGCGGFAGATCDDPAYPICMELTSTDYGVCVDGRERDCICAGAPATVDKC